MVIRKPRQRGSIYVLTLLTVAAVGSMVIIGVSVRTATSAESAITEQVNTNNEGTLSAAELAIAKIEADADWVTNAQKGTVFSDLTLDERTYTSTVIDDDTKSTPTASTANYRVKVTSSSGIAREMASFGLEWVKSLDYAALLKGEGAKFYWALNEEYGATIADDPVGNVDGGYQDKEVVGQGTNDEGGVVPVFNDNSDHVRVPYDSGFDNGKGAYSLWLKNTNTNPFKLTGVIGMRYNGSGDVPTLSVVVVGRSLVVMICEDGFYRSEKFTYTGSNTILDNTWHHVAINFGSDTGVEVYIDGKLEGQNLSNRDAVKSAANHSLAIGAGYSIMSWMNSREGFEGSIAHVAMFHDPLTSEQIELLSTTKPDAKAIALTDQSWQIEFE